MTFWLWFWTVVLVAGIGVFAVLAVVVAIGGFFDIRSLFKSIESQHHAHEAEKPTPGQTT